MSTRRAKQLIYGALYVVVFGLIGAACYGVVLLMAPKVPVAAPCTENCIPSGVGPIVTSTVTTFVTSPQHYTFLEQIANTDSDYTAEYFTYSFDIYDASGTVIQSVPGTSFLYAGQTKFIVAPNVTVADPGVATGFSIDNVYWVASSTLGEIPQFSVQNTQSSETTSTVTVSGQITNQTIAAFQYVLVDVVFKGPSGSPVGATQTELNGLQPGQTVDFSVFYPANGSIDPSNNEVFVYGIRG